MADSFQLLIYFHIYKGLSIFERLKIVLVHFFRKVSVQECMDYRLFNFDQSLTINGDLRLVDDSFDIFDLFL